MVDRDPDAPMIIKRLDDEGIEYLYHFTNLENLTGISSHNALCSKKVLETCGEWPCPSPGGNDLSHVQDRKNNNWEKIALNFTPQTPMVYHKKRRDHLCFLLIAKEVAGWRDVIFTDTNSASTNHTRATGIAGMSSVRFDKVREAYIPNDSDWIKYVQAEALVPNLIPMEHVEKIVFVSEASMRLGSRFWGDNAHPEFKIEMPIFEDIPDPENPTIGFPYVLNIILTNEIITRINVHGIDSSISKYHRKKDSHITSIIRVNIFAGTKGVVKWTDGIEGNIEFQQSGKRIWWPSVSLDDLPDGLITMEVTLNNILWATYSFEVVS